MKTTLFTYVWKTGKTAILLFGLILLAGLIIFMTQLCRTDDGLIVQWNMWLAPYVSFTTVLITIFIWFIEKKRAFRDQLPKKLNVTYLCGADRWEVQNAPLTDEADIRQWGQSFAQAELNNNERLALSGFKLVGRANNTDHTRYFFEIYLKHPLKAMINTAIKFDDFGKQLNASEWRESEEFSTEQPH